MGQASLARPSNIRLAGHHLPAVSIVIPTFRRDELLERALRSVCHQDYHGPQPEIIVVDDGRSPTTTRVVHRVGESFSLARLRLIEGAGRGPAAARNRGWRAAGGEIIAFLDDDAYAADERWLANGVAPFSDPAVVAVTGDVRVPLPARPTDFQRNVARLESAAFLTCNAFCRRTALQAIDGFDERFTVPFREDSDLQFRLEERGRVVRSPAARVVHPAPRGTFGVSLRLQRYSMFNALMYAKHPARFAELGASRPTHYYAMLAALAIAATALAAGRGRFAGAAAAAWLALVARFFEQRIRGTSLAPWHIASLVVTTPLIPALSVYWRLRGAAKFHVFFY